MYSPANQHINGLWPFSNKKSLYTTQWWIVYDLGWQNMAKVTIAAYFNWGQFLLGDWTKNHPWFCFFWSDADRNRKKNYVVVLSAELDGTGINFVFGVTYFLSILKKNKQTWIKSNYSLKHAKSWKNSATLKAQTIKSATSLLRLHGLLFRSNHLWLWESKSTLTGNTTFIRPY